MTIFGSADVWAEFFPDDLIPDILNMVVVVWSSFTKPNFNDHEVPITKRFRSSLEQYKDLKMLPIRIDREVPVDNLDTAQELGRIDLRLTHGYRSDVYFAFECKRLNVSTEGGKLLASLAGEYAGVNGMMRFVGSEPQYGKSLKQGGMIGYVMNGKTANAIKSVDKQVKKHHIDLQMKSSDGLSSSSRLSKSCIKETSHHLPDVKFMLHHVFLPV